MDIIPTIDQARLAVAEAQATLDAAVAHQEKLDSFPTIGTVFLVSAKKMTFDQWVTYDEAGVPEGVFNSREEAERYILSFKAPIGFEFRINELELHN
jgi:hypothetical protein